MNTNTLTLSLLLSSSLVAGCGGATGSTGFDDYADSEQIVSDFSSIVVIPGYELLATRLAEFSAAVEALSANATPGNLAAAKQAWISSRVPWEQSEGFLFGPVDSGGYDPALDSWPVNRTDLDAVLSSDDAITQAFVANLDDSLKGFHTAECLLFGEGNTKMVGDFSARDLEYTAAVAAEMATISEALYQDWISGEQPYGDLLSTAGQDENTVYTSRGSAAEEIVRGMIGILDEVSNGKIADPYVEQDQTLVESQFSFNSLTDFADNVRSVQNLYTGDNPEAGTSGLGLSTYVASIDSELDTRIAAEIADSIAAIEAIEGPFRDAILDPASADAIENAQAKIWVTMESVEGDLLPLFTDY